jgi:hypothetical protein
MSIAFRQVIDCPHCGQQHTAENGFSRWSRKMAHQGNLPSSVYVVSDIDQIIHRYKTEIDRQGTREVQHIGFLEVKSNQAKVSASQKDTLLKLHRRLYGDGKVIEYGDKYLKFWGVSVLRMENTCPESGRLTWQHYEGGEQKLIGISTLLDLLLFVRHWTNFATQPLRRHHKTSEIIIQEKTALGFTVEKPIVKRT